MIEPIVSFFIESGVRANIVFGFALFLSIGPVAIWGFIGSRLNERIDSPHDYARIFGLLGFVIGMIFFLTFTIISFEVGLAEDGN